MTVRVHATSNKRMPLTMKTIKKHENFDVTLFVFNGKSYSTLIPCKDFANVQRTLNKIKIKIKKAQIL